MSKVLKLKAPKPRVERLRGLFSYIAARYLEPETDLSGLWDVSFKIDGVRMLRGTDGDVYSRMGTHQLAHIQALMPEDMTDCELFNTDWSTSMSCKAGTVMPSSEDFYSLNPLDPRLFVAEGIELTHEYCAMLLKWAMDGGYEGLMLRKQGTICWVKVVPDRFADVEVSGWVEAGGDLKGHMGSLTTRRGRVSCSTLSHEQRKWLWENRQRVLRMFVQAKYREMTPGANGKMRFARFERWRPDCNKESL